MTVFRSPMEKLLEQQENETVVTNPAEPFRTYLRKLAFKWAVLRERLRRLGRQASGRDRAED